ncbi:MAG: HAD family hydrolase [Bacilli bacterium]|nr:HAD family hydrolase [Bacilli bacterium]
MIDTILFDLDGTLLPIEEGPFIKMYFGLLSDKFLHLGITKEKFIEAIVSGTVIMRKNDGSKTNEDAFWDFFSQKIGYRKSDIEDIFINFYSNDFDLVKASSNENPLAKEVVKILKSKNYNLVVATNPLFPRIAVEKRIAWAGLDVNDFSFITSYENSFYSKPSLNYYENILKNINKKPEQCIMVGNDAKEDMAASKLGIKTYLLVDCLINLENLDISRFENGDFENFLNLVKKLPDV